MTVRLRDGKPTLKPGVYLVLNESRLYEVLDLEHADASGYLRVQNVQTGHDLMLDREDLQHARIIATTPPSS